MLYIDVKLVASAEMGETRGGTKNIVVLGSEGVGKSSLCIRHAFFFDRKIVHCTRF